jgi:hypothetical protein
MNLRFHALTIVTACGTECWKTHLFNLPSYSFHMSKYGVFQFKLSNGIVNSTNFYTLRVERKGRHNRQAAGGINEQTNKMPIMWIYVSVTHCDAVCLQFIKWLYMCFSHTWSPKLFYGLTFCVGSAPHRNAILIRVSKICTHCVCVTLNFQMNSRTSWELILVREIHEWFQTQIRLIGNYYWKYFKRSEF